MVDIELILLSLWIIVVGMAIMLVGIMIYLKQFPFIGIIVVLLSLIGAITSFSAVNNKLKPRDYSKNRL